jgi:hypothetical protein
LPENREEPLKKLVLTFGLISGGIISAMTAITLPLCLNGTIDLDNSQILGYSIMVLAFIMVFFGIRSYRDNAGGGTITFGRAFKVGILITLITCAVYVVAWEIVYWNFLPDFADRYAALSIQKMRDRGESAAAIAKATQDMARFKELYANPLINIGMTFMEIFPVGLIVTLISAAILKRKPGNTPIAATA